IEVAGQGSHGRGRGEARTAGGVQRGHGRSRLPGRMARAIRVARDRGRQTSTAELLGRRRRQRPFERRLFATPRARRIAREGAGPHRTGAAGDRADHHGKDRTRSDGWNSPRGRPVPRGTGRSTPRVSSQPPQRTARKPCRGVGADGRAAPDRGRPARGEHARPQARLCPLSVGFGIAGLAYRGLAGRLRRSHDRCHPGRSRNGRADPLGPGHPLLRSPGKPGRGESVVNETAQTSWPDPPAAGPLGDGRPATARLRPETVVDLCQAVGEHAGEGLAIYPQGGTTALDYGGIPGRPGVAIDTRSLCRVIDYPHADMTITVQAGITAASLHAVLAEQNQRLLIDIPQADRATLGGVFATNTSGPRRFGLGRPRDQIIGVNFVTSQGIEVKGGGRVVKNVAGYDLPKLLTGSMGTLGIITQMTFKVRPMPEASAIVWVPFTSLASLGGTLEALNTSGSRPVALDLLSAPAARIIGEPLNVPAGDWVLVIGLEDNATSLSWQLNRLMIELGRADLTILQNEHAAAGWAGLTEFSAAELGPVSCVVSIRPSGVIPFVESIDPGRWAVQAHAGNGIVRLHALGDWTLDHAAAEIDRFRSLTEREGGSVILARCPTGWKVRLGVWGRPRADWPLAERVKQALDPIGALNPGRFIGRI